MSMPRWASCFRWQPETIRARAARSRRGTTGSLAVVGTVERQPVYYTLHTAQFTVSYVPDLWGGTRRQIENLEALKENQRFTNEATFLTLTSSIALGAIQEASLARANRRHGTAD